MLALALLPLLPLLAVGRRSPVVQLDVDPVEEPASAAAAPPVGLIRSCKALTALLSSPGSSSTNPDASSCSATAPCRADMLVCRSLPKTFSASGIALSLTAELRRVARTARSAGRTLASAAGRLDWAQLLLSAVRSAWQQAAASRYGT